MNVFPIETPALRERPEDLPLLITELTKRVEAECNQSVKFSDRAIESLQASHWSGNVRELANLVERMIIMFPGQVVDITELPKKYQSFDVEAFVPDYPEELMERDAIYSLFGDDYIFKNYCDGNLLIGNSDSNTATINELNPAFYAQIIRIYPVDYYNHKSMRLEIFADESGLYTCISSVYYIFCFYLNN